MAAPPTGSVTVESVGPDDWRRWRDLRLAGLRDAPEAFGSSYADWRDADEQRWRARISAPGNLMVASLDGVPVGMVGCGEPRAGVVELISMWVRPDARGRGVGDTLVEAVVDRARTVGAGAVELCVMEGNEPAERLYERHGFARTGGVRPGPPDGSTGTQIVMSRPV
jgi:GNAT superfamily N-acetyltransferase